MSSNEHLRAERVRLEFDGHKLRELMYKNNLTTRSLGEKIGYSSPAVNHWMTGASTPNRRSLDAINDYFHVTDEYWKKDVEGAFEPKIKPRQEAVEAFEKNVHPREVDKAKVRESIEKLRGSFVKLAETIADPVDTEEIEQETYSKVATESILALEEDVKEKEIEIEKLRLEISEKDRLIGHLEGVIEGMKLTMHDSAPEEKPSFWQRIFA